MIRFLEMLQQAADVTIFAHLHISDDWNVCEALNSHDSFRLINERDQQKTTRQT